MKQKINELINQVENLTVVRVVRDSLVHMIPVLITGAFALVVQTFPVDAYQSFLKSVPGGFLLRVAELIFSATFGVLSVHMTYSVSRSYMRLSADPDSMDGGAVLASMISFFVLAGVYLPNFSLEDLGAKTMFLAILTGLFASALYLRLERFTRRRWVYLYSPGANRLFDQMLRSFFPIALVSLLFALVNALIMDLFHVNSFRMLLAHLFNHLFSFEGMGFLKGFLFVLLSSLLWFFGIHGSDTLEGVMQTYFKPGLEVNQTALLLGQKPHIILTKEFFDCFVLIGGCGTSICLLIAILCFSRSQARRGLGMTAAFPMLFNINELMVFGLPIIFNPILLIPFLSVPLLCYTTAYLALSSGLVPIITHSVEWTTPVLLSGYAATGSINGALLQLVNVAIGVLVYLPFVRILDRQSERETLELYKSFLDYYRSHESEMAGVRLTELKTLYGDFARELCAQLRHDMKVQAALYYQPQYRYDGSCMGVEALLRWKHPVHGMLYPPLVFQLAEEGGFLADLEEMVLSRALSERERVLDYFGQGIKLSVNVTGTTVVTPRFLHFCGQMNQKHPFRGQNICLEVTEQATLTFHEDTLASLNHLKQMGLTLAIDDFSMGQTSVHYLKNNLFDIIKLDGSLVRGLFSVQNCQEIISSITHLASALNLTVLAEYVETEEQRSALHTIGCDCYQGYLYSPAVPLPKE